MNTESNVDRFIKWLRRESARLKRTPSPEAADLVGEHLLQIDPRLGVEIQRPGQKEPREMIFTAFSDADAFPIVRDLVKRLGSSADWNFIALKPPRGFDFSVTLAGQKIRAARAKFRKIEKDRFKLILPGISPRGENAEELAWLIVETGVGEELTATIVQLEFGADDDLDGTERPISDLAEHIRSNE